ncbi:MAG TPA: PQQ-dependent dehydrogenase, methanol/ethanol family [Steroidobacteraceae bacterium]|nr:PQQ-dependent dehydrogenase, methanol/ethanol family [Steroidobacteraceae bacterium]
MISFVRPIVALLMIAALSLGAAAPASAQAPGEPSAVWPHDCDHDCLTAIAWRYIDALVHHEVRQAPLAPDVRYTENDVPMPIGTEGLWTTIGSAARDALTAADAETGNVAWLGAVRENDHPAYLAVRLKVEHRLVTEVETVVERPGGLPAPFGDPDKLVHDPAFDQVLPPEQRRERERLRDVANGYFSTIARNDGALLTLFDPDCQRLENGISTTSGRFGSAALAQGCQRQFELGYFRINKRVRDRRYPIIDTQRGVVVATGFFDHDNSFDRYRTTDGKEHRTLLKWPNSLSLMEAFKIRNGRIYRVEAIFTYVPYFMPSPWVRAPQAGSAAAAPSATPPAAMPPATADDCDRSCLLGIAQTYMSALPAHDPARLPWGPSVRYTENSVPMMVGDGQWNTVSGVGRAPLCVADPASGNVAWLGVVLEHGEVAHYAMRLRVVHHRIVDVEVVVDGKGEPGPFGDTADGAPDPAFTALVPPAERSSRERMIALADGYFSTLQRNDGTIRTTFAPDCERRENGLSTTHGGFGSSAIAEGCEAQFKLGLYRYDDAVRARRFPVVDVEHGIVVATGFIDHSARLREFRTTDGRMRKSHYDAPNSLALMEAFKIRHGAIDRIESVFSEVPYLMPSPWTESGGADADPTRAADVDQSRLDAADSDPGDWMSVGRTWSEQRFSPLAEINARNVRRLGLAWYADLDTYRGVEATPLEIDGHLYNISAWDVTTAYDATTGKVLWRYDPRIPLEWSRRACCGPVSRGLAAWRGRIIIATLDGRLIALDAASGKPLWSVQTLEPGQPLSITGAPRVADGLAIIGNGGGDFGARGYLSAYDAETGRLVWRFYIVPGNPAKGPEGAASDSVMPMAAKTWTGKWWELGGGGNDWDTIVYDPQLSLVYFGTGNGSPHPEAFRSPGGGDNLFLCSIVAVDARTGRYVWHYQEIPGEEWDYDCTNPLIIADLKIHGRLRQTILHAPKDGFFYVLDRRTGQLISAQHYVPNTWASRVDLETGRPLINRASYVAVKPHLMTPGYGGGHNWNPMSYSPLTGLVYIPAQEQWMVESRLPDGQFQFVRGRSTLGAGVNNYPELRRALNAEAAQREKGYLLAWNPVTQKEAFRIPYPHPGNGGTLVTAGNLLIEGTIDKTLAIYRADDGRKLWEQPVETVPVAGPMTYSVRGKQYIAVNAGWNSAIVQGLENFSVGPARLLVFSLDAHGVTLPPAPAPEAIPAPPATVESEETVARGALLYSQYCASCHGPNAVGGVKDLRHLTAAQHAAFTAIVLGGTLRKQGMASFNDVLAPEQVESIHAYVINRAQEDWQPSFTAPKQK